jgi:hypothetical protein
VSQQLVPVHALDAQHCMVAAPQALHVPFWQISPAVLQLALFPMHVLLVASQQAPAAEHGVAPGQHAFPVPPQPVHLPPVQTSFVPPHAPLAETHLSSVGSQHEPDVVHVELAQQTAVSAPHAVHVPFEQTMLVPPSVPAHALFASTHVLFEGSQHAPAPVQGVAPAQHAFPFVPQAEHDPPVQTVFAAVHAWLSATHLFVVGSQHPVLHAEPAQQFSPASPQSGAASSVATSFGASTDVVSAGASPPLLESAPLLEPVSPEVTSALPSFATSATVPSCPPLPLPPPSPVVDSGTVPSVVGPPSSPVPAN